MPLVNTFQALYENSISNIDANKVPYMETPENSIENNNSSEHNNSFQY